MMSATPDEGLSDHHQNVLQRAFHLLENPDFAARLAEHAGRPIERALRMMPKIARDRINRIVEAAVLNCLNVAVGSLGAATARPPASAASAVLAGVGGGVSGFIGLAALPVELPITTTLMLRSIAEIARHHGEDLSKIESRLACVEVLGLGARRLEGGADLGYLASRALLARMVANASSALAERGVAGVSSPVVAGLVVEIAQRFGIVVTERASASALPVLGALGGASVSYIFMKHFQRVAHGHFSVRRLERHYGFEVVQSRYRELAARHSGPTRPPDLMRIGRSR